MSREIQPLEKSIRRAIRKYLDSLGPDCYARATTKRFGHSGVPDFVGCYRGRYFALEVKRPVVGEATALQLREIELIRKAGGFAGVVTSVDEARAAIEKLRAEQEESCPKE